MAHNHCMTGEFAVLEGATSTATLDTAGWTLTFDHHGSVATDEQKALSPLVIPLGAIEAVECRPGHSTNWFWVVQRGDKPWRKGVWCDPRGVVSTVDPTEFAESVRAAVALASPADAVEVDGVSAPRNRGWAGKFARAVVDGFFNSR